MKITIINPSGAGAVIEATHAELSEATEFASKLYSQALELGEEEIEVVYEDDEVEPKPEKKKPSRALTSRGTLPPAPFPLTHADDCECSKCHPKSGGTLIDMMLGRMKGLDGSYDDLSVEVPLRHMPVLNYLVALRKGKQCARATNIAAVLGLDTAAVSGSLQYLRAHGLVYNGANTNGELLSMGNNSHVWTATMRAICASLIAA